MEQSFDLESTTEIISTGVLDGLKTSPVPLWDIDVSSKVFIRALEERPVCIDYQTPSGLRRFDLPAEDVHRLVGTSGGDLVVLQSTSTHTLDALNRWPDSVEIGDQARRQQSTCVTVHSATSSRGFIIPTVLQDGATLVCIEWERSAPRPTFTFHEFKGGEFVEILPREPGKTAGTMHATQNLSHINEGFKLLKHADTSSSSNLSLVVPGVSRSRLLIESVPQHLVDKVQGWTYLQDGNVQFTTNLSTPAAMESVVGFLASNLDLSKRVLNGDFKVIASDFRAEPQLLALINPHTTLVGYNYTFLSGSPSEYAASAKQPCMRQLVRETGLSLQEFEDILNIERRDPISCDWWKLTQEKLGVPHRPLDLLAYRTLQYDPNTPKTVDGIPVLQVPHPVAPLSVSRADARAQLARELGFDPNSTKVIVVPGLSDDGLFEQRLRCLAGIVESQEGIVMVSPLDARRLAEICNVPSHSPNIHGIGFREKWGEVLVACDAAIIRGSWGEILDCIRAGVVPIFSSPGVIDRSDSLDRNLFLQEVLGERAINLALFYEALGVAGIPNNLLKDLVVGSDNNPELLSVAIKRATESAMALAIRETFNHIRKDGVEQLVGVYQWLEGMNHRPTVNDVQLFERAIWGLR